MAVTFVISLYFYLVVEESTCGISLQDVTIYTIHSLLKGKSSLSLRGVNVPGVPKKVRNVYVYRMKRVMGTRKVTDFCLVVSTVMNMVSV